MESKSIDNPSTKYVHTICRFLYFCGLGDYWYKETVRTNVQKYLYKIYSFVSMAWVFVMIMMVVSSFFKKRITDEEKFDVLLFSTAHPFIYAKWITTLYYRENIKKLLHLILVETSKLFFDSKTEIAQLERVKRYNLLLVMSAYVTLTLTTLYAARKYYTDGVPIRTVVTYYPDFDDTCWKANCMRIMTQFYWWHIVTGMLATDFLAITCLVFLSFKFMTLRQYFENIKKNFESNEKVKTHLELEDELRDAFIDGLKLHRNLLKCARNVQSSLGFVYSFQLTQTVGSLVICLVKLVNTERDLMNLGATFAFISCLLILTGTYMWSSGDITYEASLVSDSMFHCGWHLCSSRPRMRKLVVVGIIRSQVPVIMTAFGVFDLSYENYISIIKKSYSLFAVLY